MRTPFHQNGIALTILLVAGQCPAAETLADLIRLVPPAANAVLFIDADALRKSPLGMREGWAKNHEQDSRGSVGSLPTEVERMVVAAQINATTLDHVWKVSVAATRSALTPGQLAKAEGGAIDTVAAHDVVLSPRNAYYAILAPQVVGAMHPANRQELARWLRATQSPRDTLSPYLRQVMASPETPIVLALDTADVFDPPGLRAKLAKSKALAGRTGELERIVQAIAGLKGLRLTVRVGSKLDGELTLDSNQASALAPVAKALVLEALSGAGSAVEDLDDWTAQQRGTAIVMSGPLTETGLRQMLSLLLSPSVTTSASSTPSKAGDSDGKPTAAASKKFFRSVTKLLDELRRQKSQTYTILARRYQDCAQDIDELPILGVDPDLLKWGGDIAVTLRSMGTLAKGTQSQQGLMSAQTQSAPTQTSGSYNTADAWGYSYSIPTTSTGTVTNAQQVQSLMATAGANERVIRSKTWENIDNATGQIRRTMTIKYKEEF